MHGVCGGGEERGRARWHMLPVPANVGAAEASPTVSPPIDADSCSDRYPDGLFLKDGRKIHIGDCALFQSGNSPAFIGIIRSLTSIKEDYPKLIVNWLYRPADIKLAKGILLEAAPNEVFYSFHKDEISAESLLHPCKVAFLRRGVELPSGISSFVCRRVYDISNKCLWWLTDQDYINERQEEVDQLLDKTQIEMHAALQSDGRSPKQLNGSAPMQQLKSSSDSVQNSSSSGAVHMKSKRRDKADHNSESVKREHITKADYGDSANVILDGLIMEEVAKITDKEGLVDSTSVEKLISLMQLDKDEGKIDLAGRLLVADVIAATTIDRFDCLNRFVQLKGLLVLDDWLQEAHKGKVGDTSSPKEGDKSFEELVLALLRALEKLPVNLHALQTSNIGKSVNNLRSHKNLEIQKKARSLVDTWKKRVDAEFMKSGDARFVGSSQAVSWSGKPVIPETNNGRRIGDGASKVVGQSSAFKNLPVKPSHGDAVGKSIFAPPGTSKDSKLLPASYPASICTKDPLSKTANTSSGADLQFTSVKDEKSTGSSQSQNMKSSSTGLAKTSTPLRKDDVKCSPSGPVTAIKVSGGSEHHRKPGSGIPGSGVSVIKKEYNLNKVGITNRNATSNKVSQPIAISEQVLDPPIAEHGNGNRLIVRFANPGKSPVRSTSGGSFEEPPAEGSRAASPSVSEKHEQNDLKLRMEGDACQINDSAETNPEPCSDKRDIVTLASSEGVQLLTSLHKSTSENGQLEDVWKDSLTSSTGVKGLSHSDFNSKGQNGSSLCSMNVLIDSCTRSPESCIPLPPEDDNGMDLLASVATDEMLKSELAYSESPHRSSPALDGPSNTMEDGLKLSHDIITQSSDRHIGMDVNSEEIDTGVSNELLKASIEPEGNKASAVLDSKPDDNIGIEEKPILISREHKKGCTEVSRDAQMHENHNDVAQKDGCMLGDMQKVRSPSEESKQNFCLHEKGSTASIAGSDFASSSLSNVCRVTSGAIKDKIVENSRTYHSDMDMDKTVEVGKNSDAVDMDGQHAPHVSGNDSSVLDKATDVSSTFGSKNLEKCNATESKEDGRHDARNNLRSSEIEKEPPCTTTVLGEGSAPILSASECSTDDIQRNGTEHASSMLIHHEDLTRSPSKENKQCTEPKPTEDSLNEASHHTPKKCLVDGASMLNFDLNEGINADEVIQVDASVSPCVSVVCRPCLAPNAVSSIPRGCPVTVTVAAPTKGPFMPLLENLVRNKDISGWKGSAATSAFRPAEPRKLLEMPVSTSDTASGGKHGRPSLDIDLNVADARILEDMVSQHPAQRTGLGANRHEDQANSAGLDLDLNKADESLDSVQNTASTSRRWEPPFLPAGVVSGGFPNGNGLRDFDLNNGPGMDNNLESVMQNQPTKSSVLQFLPPVSSFKVNTAEFGSGSSWFPSGSAYSAVAVPPFLSDRGDGTYPMVAPSGGQRFLGPSAIGGSFSGDHYNRGSVLPSSPAMTFTPVTPFTHPGFQFPSGFPLNSGSFPGVSTSFIDSTTRACLPIPSPLVGPGNATSSQYVNVRPPYVISLSDSSASGGGSEGARKWNGHNLDLNSGPGGLDMETRTERLPSSSYQLPVTNQPIFPEEVGRIYQVSGGGFKRKEPEGGWDTERFSFKQSPWQ